MMQPQGPVTGCPMGRGSERSGGEKKLRIRILLASLSVGLSLAAQPAFAGPPEQLAPSRPAAQLLLSDAELADLPKRRDDFAEVIDDCEKQIAYQPQPMATMALDPYYDASGIRKTDNNGKEFNGDARQAFRMALCYRVEGDPRFAAAAQRILDAWAFTLTEVKTDQSKMALNFSGPFMVAAANWVRGVNDWDSAPVERFFVERFLPHSNSDKDNNHGAWGVFLEASIAALTGDAALMTKARDRWGTHIAQAVAPDGLLTREIGRSNTSNAYGGPDKGSRGIAYTHYFMLPATLAAKIFANNGQPVWTTSSGVLFEKAFQKAAAFTLHPETFPYYASNNGNLTGVRTAGYFPLLLRYYHSADAEAVVGQGDLSSGGFILLDKLCPSEQAKSEPL